MSAAHEPSMDDILRSIRRIIRSDREETVEDNQQIIKPSRQEKVVKDDDNLIMMEIHDQKRLRILEKKLKMIESEYEQKLLLHRKKMIDYRRQNQELVAKVEKYKSRLEIVSSNLKTAHDCLEKLQVKNKALKEKMLQMGRMRHGAVVLKAIQREFVNLYHPQQVQGDKLSRTIRHEIYNELSQVLQGVRNRLQIGGV